MRKYQHFRLPLKLIDRMVEYAKAHDTSKTHIAEMGIQMVLSGKKPDVQISNKVILKICKDAGVGWRARYAIVKEISRYLKESGATIWE